MRGWQVPVSKWWHGVYRLPRWIILLGACNRRNGMQSWRTYSDNSSEQLHTVCSGDLPIIEQRDGVH